MKIFEFVVRDKLNKNRKAYTVSILSKDLKGAEKLADVEINKMNYEGGMCVYNLKREEGRVIEKDINEPMLLNCYANF